MRLFFILFFCTYTFKAQNGFQISGSSKTVFRFQFINNLIFLPVKINGVDLTFLLDSGVAETILFSLDNKEVNFKNIEKIKFTGLGENEDVEGLKSIHNDLQIGKNFQDQDHTVYILLNEDINFSSHVGIPVNGILGYHFFKNHPVEINFVTKKITVYNTSEDFSKRKKFEDFPISIELNKPYFYADVEMRDERKNSKLLLDLGNSDAIWLFPSLIKNFIYNRPNIDDFLGRGFNGDIYGKRSRIHGLYFGSFSFDKPLTAMPDEFSIQHLKLVEGRKGSVGSEILRRFKVVFDYPNQKMYLQKNKYYSDPFLFNKSGLDIKHDGLVWQQDVVKVETKAKPVDGIEVFSSKNDFQYKFVLKPQYSVSGCRKNSPCDEAGILKDDKIVKIDGRAAGNFSLNDIYELFKDPEERSVNLEVERNFKILKFNFKLVDPIPYQENENP